jgi:hypothetical protein
MMVGLSRLEALFDAPSYAVLASESKSKVSGIVRRNSEFQFHENGHATGLGFRHKSESGFFRRLHHCGVEEWRADGVEFHLASKFGGGEMAAAVAAAC